MDSKGKKTIVQVGIQVDPSCQGIPVRMQRVLLVLSGQPSLEEAHLAMQSELKLPSFAAELSGILRGDFETKPKPFFKFFIFCLISFFVYVDVLRNAS